MFEVLQEFWLYVDKEFGWNFIIFTERYEYDRFIRGLWTTFKLSVACIVFSILIGIVGAWLQGARSKTVRWVVNGYIQFFRNTPPLVQLFFFYFGLGVYTPAVDMGGWEEPIIGGVGWAIISLSFFAGSFNVEIFRAGIEAVPSATREACEALCFSRRQTFTNVVFPLALRASMPALTSNLVNLVKATTNAYAIAVPEMLYTLNQVWSDNLNVPEMMIVLLLVYFLLVACLVATMEAWQRKLAIPGYGAT